MPVPTSMVGATAGPWEHDVDARWTMAYAAALGDHLGCYMDTTRRDGVVAHPLFPVCVEWPVIVEGRDASSDHGVTLDELRRGVHASHDLTVHRLVRPGDRLTTTMEVTGVSQRPPGAFTTMRLTTVDAGGEPVATTEQGSLYLGVDAEGSDAPAALAAPPLDAGDDERGDPRVEIAVPIAAGAAHIYTECARIWNPIHTDAAVAAAAGLPGIILHGTATLAHGVSGVVAHAAAGDPAAVRRIAGRFSAMVLMPSTVTVRVFAERSGPDGTTLVPFDVLAESGTPAVSRAAVLLG